jgi:LysM repeat protein
MLLSWIHTDQFRRISLKQKTRISYWFLPVVVLLFLVLVGCVRPVPAPDVTATPENIPTVVMPTLAPATPLPDPAYPSGDGVVETTPSEVTDPNAGLATAVPAGQSATHTVQDGETLDSLSQLYGVSIDEIAVANNLTTSSALVAGQVVVIPVPGTVVVTQPEAQPVQPEQPVAPPSGEQVHVVQPGENLFRISLSYGKTVDEVAAYNGIANPHYIYPGQVIRIP